MWRQPIPQACTFSRFFGAWIALVWFETVSIEAPLPLGKGWWRIHPTMQDRCWLAGVRIDRCSSQRLCKRITWFSSHAGVNFSKMPIKKFIIQKICQLFRSDISFIFEYDPTPSNLFPSTIGIFPWWIYILRLQDYNGNLVILQV